MYDDEDLNNLDLDNLDWDNPDLDFDDDHVNRDEDDLFELTITDRESDEIFYNDYA